MRTKVLLILGLCVLLFNNQVNAQKVHPESSSYRFSEGYFTFVECDGVTSDFIQGGPLNFHFISHSVNGEVVWDNYIVHGEAPSLLTDEVFKVSEAGKLIYDSGTATIRFNLKGNMGNHYIGEVNVDLNTFEFTFNRTVCISK